MRLLQMTNDPGPWIPAFLPMLLKIEGGIRVPDKIPSAVAPCRAKAPLSPCSSLDFLSLPRAQDLQKKMLHLI
jgi:hypothetical protein